jgi:(2R)-3-sulfolactate dehydrogenase (NADP+)
VSAPAEVTLRPRAVEDLVTRALIASGTSSPNAASTATALVAAEVDGQPGHGLSRVASYAAQVRAGKVDGHAKPTWERMRTASVRIDAKGGFAYPALDLAIETLIPLARATGIAAAGIFASHHIGQAGRTVERLADQELVALVVSNTPQAMAFPGGVRPMLGTNPLAFAAPLPGRPPLVVDLALSLVSRSKITAAQKAGARIPTDWAINTRGEPTSDPAEALAGALLPAGGPKGAALALMVEVLCAALAGGNYGWEADSFLDDKGASPGVGQMLIAIDTGAFTGGPGSELNDRQFASRMTDLLGVVAGEPGVRLPGERRLAHRANVHKNGLSIDAALHAQLLKLASAADPGAGV